MLCEITYGKKCTLILNFQIWSFWYFYWYYNISQCFQNAIRMEICIGCVDIMLELCSNDCLFFFYFYFNRLTYSPTADRRNKPQTENWWPGHLGKSWWKVWSYSWWCCCSHQPLGGAIGGPLRQPWCSLVSQRRCDAFMPAVLCLSSWLIRSACGSLCGMCTLP